MLYIKLINSVTKFYDFVKAVRKQMFFFGVKCSTIFPLYLKLDAKDLFEIERQEYVFYFIPCDFPWPHT